MKNEYIEDALGEIGYKLKILRIRKGFSSSEEFSNKYDLPKIQYSKMENGSVSITLVSLLKVLQVHQLSLENFFCMDSNKAAA